MFIQNNRPKSIKWKHAFLIVLLLHGFGYLGIAQYAKYKKQKAIELKNSKESLYVKGETKSSDWPKSQKNKLVVVAAPPKSAPLKNKENTISGFIKNFENFFGKKIEIVKPSITIVEAKPKFKTSSKPSPTPKKVYASSVSLKPVPTPTPLVKFVYNKQKETIVEAEPTPIPVKRAIPVDNERRLIKSTSTKHYSKSPSNFDDNDWKTTETVEVIGSYIVLY
jgi:hypothetical protein